ncbi:MAG: C-GCAxxG-C-C family protein [Proteobacteria bacterium]|nr:C-GCAxxG-C-C family protein [Pseudomonadota bacterium]MBU1738164.1 C-GCAxxG-C-C family protein [Pseudomonadota bacterium]
MLAVGQEKIGKISEEAVKAVGAFGGGLAGSGGPCGIMLGGVAFISSMYSRGNLEGKEDPRMWSLSGKFMQKFNTLCEEFASTNCRDIAQVNWQDREAAKEYYGNPESRRKICIRLIGDAACALGEILDQDASKEPR